MEFQKFEAKFLDQLGRSIDLASFLSHLNESYGTI